MITEEDVKTALRSVNDPELPVSVWDLGLIAGIQIREDQIAVQVTFTSLGCGCTDWIVADVADALERIAEGRRVRVEVVWSPSWNKDRMTETARRQLLRLGVQS